MTLPVRHSGTLTISCELSICCFHEHGWRLDRSLERNRSLGVGLEVIFNRADNPGCQVDTSDRTPLTGGARPVPSDRRPGIRTGNRRASGLTSTRCSNVFRSVPRRNTPRRPSSMVSSSGGAGSRHPSLLSQRVCLHRSDRRGPADSWNRYRRRPAERVSRHGGNPAGPGGPHRREHRDHPTLFTWGAILLSREVLRPGRRLDRSAGRSS